MTDAYTRGAEAMRAACRAVTINGTLKNRIDAISLPDSVQPAAVEEKREVAHATMLAPNKTLAQIRPGPFMHFHQDGPHLGFKSEYTDDYGIIAYNEAGERFHHPKDAPLREVEFSFDKPAANPVPEPASDSVREKLRANTRAMFNQTSLNGWDRDAIVNAILALYDSLKGGK